MKMLIKEVWLLFRYYPLRSILSMSALIIGMATLTALVDIDNNINLNSEALINEQGTRLGVSVANSELDWTAFQQWKKQFEPHFSFYGYYSVPVQIAHASQPIPIEVISTTPELFAMAHWKILEGRHLHPLDENMKVIVIGNEVAKMLQPALDNTYCGLSLVLDGEYFSVIGVLAPIAFDPILNFDPNYSVFIESSMVANFKANAQLQNFMVSVESESLMRAEAILYQEIKMLLPNTTVFIKNPLVLQKALYQHIEITLKTLKIISLTTLVLGFLSTLNLFLILLQERKPEMGLRLALGATMYNIGWQFFKETLLMCALGGVLGVLLGEIGGIFVIRHLGLNYYWQYNGVMLGSLVSICVGTVVGIIPAIMTARQSPVKLL